MAHHQADHGPAQVVGADGRWDRPEQVEGRSSLGTEQRYHQHAVDVREHAEVHHEERDEEQLPRPVRRFARLGEEQSGHVEPTHDDVLQPVQQHQGEHRPAEQQDTRDWQGVRQEEDHQGRSQARLRA